MSNKSAWTREGSGIWKIIDIALLYKEASKRHLGDLKMGKFDKYIYGPLHMAPVANPHTYRIVVLERKCMFAALVAR